MKIEIRFLQKSEKVEDFLAHQVHCFSIYTRNSEQEISQYVDQKQFFSMYTMNSEQISFYYYVYGHILLSAFEYLICFRSSAITLNYIY